MEECPCCSDEFVAVSEKNVDPDMRPVILECFHILCKNCSLDCMKSGKPICPICKSDVFSKNELQYYDLPLPKVNTELNKEIQETIAALDSNTLLLDELQATAIQQLEQQYQNQLTRLNMIKNSALSSIAGQTAQQQTRLKTVRDKFVKDHATSERLLSLKKVVQACGKKKLPAATHALISKLTAATSAIKTKTNVVDLVDIRGTAGLFETFTVHPDLFNAGTHATHSFNIVETKEYPSIKLKIIDYDTALKSAIRLLEPPHPFTEMTLKAYSNQNSSYVLVILIGDRRVLVAQVSPDGVNIHNPIKMPRGTPVYVNYFDDSEIRILVGPEHLHCASSLSTSNTFTPTERRKRGTFILESVACTNPTHSYNIVDKNDKEVLMQDADLMLRGKYDDKKMVKPHHVVCVNGVLFVFRRIWKMDYLKIQQLAEPTDLVAGQSRNHFKFAIDMIPQFGKRKTFYTKLGLYYDDSSHVDKNHTLYLKDDDRKGTFKVYVNAFA
jgi:hypothetical protein